MATSLSNSGKSGVCSRDRSFPGWRKGRRAHRSRCQTCRVSSSSRRRRSWDGRCRNLGTRRREGSSSSRRPGCARPRRWRTADPANTGSSSPRTEWGRRSPFGCCTRWWPPGTTRLCPSRPPPSSAGRWRTGPWRGRRRSEWSGPGGPVLGFGCGPPPLWCQSLRWAGWGGRCRGPRWGSEALQETQRRD